MLSEKNAVSELPTSAGRDDAVSVLSKATEWAKRKNEIK